MRSSLRVFITGPRLRAEDPGGGAAAGVRVGPVAAPAGDELRRDTDEPLVALVVPVGQKATQALDFGTAVHLLGDAGHHHGPAAVALLVEVVDLEGHHR